MRKQTKKLLSWVLSGAMVLGLAGNVNFASVQADDEAASATELATTFDADVDFSYTGGGQRIEIANPWDSDEDAADALAKNGKALTNVQFTNLEITFDVAGTEKAFAAAKVTSASAAIQGSLDGSWSVQRWDANEAAGFTDAKITKDGTYTVSYTDAKNTVYTMNPSAAPLYVDFPELKSVVDAKGQGGLTFSNVHVKATASAYTVVNDDFATKLVKGDGKEARVMIYSQWNDIEPATMAGVRIKEAEVSFDVKNTDKAFAAAGVATSAAYVGVVSDDWSVNTLGTAPEDKVVIDKDGHYTVKYSAKDIFTLGAAFGIIFEGLNDALTEAEDKTVSGLDISNVHVNVLGLPAIVPDEKDDPVTGPSLVDEELWATKGIHAYISYQMDGTWDYRNGFNPSEIGYPAQGKAGTYDYIVAGKQKADPETTKVKDVLLNRDGQYTISISGVDLSASSKYNLLSIATDLSSEVYNDVKVSDISVKVDGEAAVDAADGASTGLSTVQKDDELYYYYPLVNIWAKEDPLPPLNELNEDGKLAVPEDSIEITFTVTGLKKALTDLKDGNYVDPVTGNKVKNDSITQDDIDASKGDAPAPSTQPTVTPTAKPTGSPAAPTNKPSNKPSNAPTKAPTKAPAKVVKKGTKVTSGKLVYKVTKVATAKKAGTLSVVSLSKSGKKAAKLSIPATAKINGKTYKVTSLGKNALKGAKASSIALGKNIKSIPAGAFANCKKLKALTVKAKLTKVAKKAFKGCKKTIKVKGASKKINKANVKKLKKSGYKKFK